MYWTFPILVPLSPAFSTPQLTHLPSSLVSSSHITLTLHFLVLPYHTILLLTPPYLVLSYLTSSPTTPQPLLYLIFSFTSINLVPHLPPSYHLLSYLILPFILSFPMLSHFSIFLIPPHYAPFFLPYFIPSHPGLSYLIPCLTLLYTISFYPILPHVPHFPQHHPHFFLPYSASSPFISLITSF